MEFFGFSLQTGEFHEEFLFWGDEGGFSEVGDFFAEFLFEQGRFGGLGGGGGHLQMFVEMIFVVGFFFPTMCCGRQRVWWNGVSFFLNAVVKGKEEKREEGGFRRRYVRYGLEMCSLCSRQILDCGDLFAIPEIEPCLVNVQTLCHACS